MESRCKPKQPRVGFYLHEWLGKHLKGKWNGLPRWFRGWDFTFQCRGCRFNSGQEAKIPHVSWPKKIKTQNRSNIATNSIQIFFKKEKSKQDVGHFSLLFPPRWESQNSRPLPTNCPQYGPIFVSTAPFLEDQNIKARHSYTKNGHPMCYCFLSVLGGVGQGGRARKLEQFLWN